MALWPQTSFIWHISIVIIFQQFFWKIECMRCYKNNLLDAKHLIMVNDDVCTCLMYMNIVDKTRRFLFYFLFCENMTHQNYMTSTIDKVVINIMTFCNSNVIFTRLICMFITRVLYDICFMTISHGKWPMWYMCIIIKSLKYII